MRLVTLIQCTRQTLMYYNVCCADDKTVNTLKKLYMGSGMLVAWHLMKTSSPSMPSTSPGPSCISGGTKTQKKITWNASIHPSKTAKSYQTNSIFWLCKTAFQSKADHLRQGYIDTFFAPVTLDFDPMALIFEMTIDILNMYLHKENKLLGHVFQKLEHCRQRDTQTNVTENITNKQYYCFIIRSTLYINKNFEIP